MEEADVAKVLAELSKLAKKMLGGTPGNEFYQGYQTCLKDVGSALGIDLDATWAGIGFTTLNDESKPVDEPPSV